MRAVAAAVLVVASCTTEPPVPDPDPPGRRGRTDGGASADAGESSDAGAGRWCAGRAEAFCDDFEVPAFSASAWSVNDSTGAGGSALSGAALAYLSSASPPNSFAARVPTVSAGSTFFQLQKSGGSPSSANHVEADLAFSVRVATHCTGPRTEIARVEGVNPINFASYGLALLVAPSGAAIELNRGPQGVTTRPLATAPALATWTRIAIHLGMDRVVTGPPTSLTVKVGEGAAESFSLDPGMGVQPYIRLGLHVSAPSGPCEVAYDNVVYDTR